MFQMMLKCVLINRRMLLRADVLVVQRMQWTIEEDVCSEY